MPILMTAEAEGLTAQLYAGMLAQLQGALSRAPGLVLHTAHPTEASFRVVEIWRSKRESDEFFTRHVAPNLPPGVRPKRRTRELESLVTPMPLPADPPWAS
jgi:hypothetical protein